jgi:glycosyltransferase involved in cell wall biosynthesis
MNILFVLYGGFNTNSANPLVLYARELQRAGHNCTIAVPVGLDTVRQHDNITFRPVLYDDVLSDPASVFPDGRRADVIHACTPREIVRIFITRYLSLHPTPLVFYLEDNESWIAMNALGLSDQSLAQHTSKEISAKLPKSLSHPLYVDDFVGLADVVAIIQDKLKVMVPPWVACETVMIGIDIEFFSPRPKNQQLREKYGVSESEKILVYHGGMNAFTRPAIKSLCVAVGIINQKGVPCKLLRCGPNALDFLDQLPEQAAAATADLGVLAKTDLPDLLALADVLVQPGEINDFEQFRLPGKIPEFLAMGLPVILPDVNISNLFSDGEDVILLKSGSPAEIADKCLSLFSDPEKAKRLGNAGRKLAEQYFDVRKQTRLLEQVYLKACKQFNVSIAEKVWRDADANTDVALLLGTRLNLMAEATQDDLYPDNHDMLREHGNYIEAMAQRNSGLESRVQKLKDDIRQLEKNNAALSELNSKQESEHKESLQQLELQHYAENTRRDAEITRRDAEINAIFQSSSWRITRPLRFIATKLKNARSLTPHAQAIMIHGKAITIRQLRVLARTLLPLIRRGVPVKVKALFPDRLRQAILQRVEGRTVTPIQASSAIHYMASNQTQSLMILYVINHVDIATQRYRVFNYAVELADMGIASRIVTEDKLTDADITDIDLVVFNRICWSPRLEHIFVILRDRGVPAIFDVDDLIFDPARQDLLRGIKARSQEAQATFLDGMHRWRRTLLESDLVTASTFALRREVENLGKHAYVLPNTIGKDIRQIADEIGTASDREHSEFVDIGYFSGTRTHEADFAECKSALIRVLEHNPSARLHIVGELEDTEEFIRFDNRFVRHPLMRYEAMIRLLGTIDIVIAPLELNNTFTECKSELKAFEPALFSIPCIATPTSTFAAAIDHGRNGMLAATEQDWYKAITNLVSDREFRHRLGREANRTFLRRHAAASAAREAASVYRALVGGRIPREYQAPTSTDITSSKPVISVIAILYNKADEVRYFLESLRRQDINDRFEVILIDDMSPDNSVAVVQQYLYWKQFYSVDNMDVVILKNDSNKGNCASRNLGVQSAKSEILLIVDADCVFDPGFLSSHVSAHQTGCCDVAIGPRGIETGDEDPFSCLGRLETDLASVQKESRFQDPINLDSFVNCVTRNFSIKRSLVADYLFDEAFTYSKAPESGFGWEDVELGCRLYKAGARIWHLPHTISLHVSHGSAVEEASKPIRSLRNFRRLHEKHPDLLLESRQWTLRTFDAIVKWAKVKGADIANNEDYVFLSKKFEPLANIPRISLPARPLRVLTHRWHIAHQYELYRLGHQFNLVTGAGTKMCDSWSSDIRPIPTNAGFIPFSTVKPGDYDLMILHFDENLLHPERCQNKVPADWSKTFLSLLQLKSEIPTVAICHGTPQFAGQYDLSYDRDDLGEVNESAREEIVTLLRDITVVCNSYQSEREWQFKKSRVIWHGFSPHDFPRGKHDREVGLMLERAMSNRPHYNGYFIYQEIKNLLSDTINFSSIDVPDPQRIVPKSREWAAAKFHNYVRELGRFSIYLNPTVRSPMPRIRGEAMMAGVVSVNLGNHDVDMFIQNGVNGFYASESAELAEQISFLIKNPATRERIGSASRLTALDIFNQDRYLADWSKLINDVV